ncbi:hypothetical protein MPC4_20309 [Methylocella tundrae]|uniref:Uncharacterized protein n=1 Tax=Methylocella tundrae TaxID=227605 RepID=A0A8B6M6Q3_METTU|nr:hypothetical protein MPC4_20309 [Methylocella tundrae]
MGERCESRDGWFESARLHQILPQLMSAALAGALTDKAASASLPVSAAKSFGILAGRLKFLGAETRAGVSSRAPQRRVEAHIPDGMVQPGSSERTRPGHDAGKLQTFRTPSCGKTKA